MRKLTRVFISLLGMTIILGTYYAIGADNRKDDDKAVIAIEVSVSGKTPLTVPVLGERKSSIIPVTGAKTSAVKIVSWTEGSSVMFEVLAVLDPLPEVRSCDNLKALKTELITSHTGRVGEIIRVSSLEKFGVAPFNVSVTTMSALPQGCPSTCCCCAPLQCCPKKEACLTCGDCGICCMG